MKISVFLLFAFIIFISCETKKSQQEKEAEMEKKAQEEVQDIINSTADEIEAEAPKKRVKPNWETLNYNDDFGDPTGDKFIQNSIKGSFSNSATSYSDLYAKVRIDKNSAGIFLHERKWSSPAVKPIRSMTISMKNANGKTIRIMTSQSWNTSGGISIADPNMRYKLVNFIKQSPGEIKVVVKDSYSSVYRFDFNANGFTKAYNQL